MKAKPYPKYKSSGVDWLDDVPEHWDIKRLKYLVSERLKYGANESAEYDDPTYPRYIRITDFGEDGKLRPDTFRSLPDEIAQEYLLNEGDILFARSGATVGKTFQFKDYSGQACFAGYLIKATPIEKDISTDFLYYYTKSQSYESWKNSIFIQATIQNIGAEKYNNLNVPLPTLSDQKQIVTYLDRKTSKIDALIEKKRLLIDKLREERSALITATVTGRRTIDGKRYPKYKPSGIEWLGDVPEHWKIKRLKYLVSDRLKYGANESAEHDDPIYPRYIRITDFGEDGKLRDDTFRSLPDEIALEYLLQDGDILFARSGATVGKTFQFKNYDGRACFAGYLIKASPFEKEINTDYLYYFTKSYAYESWKNSIFIQATIQNIGAEKYNNLTIPFPIISEQKKIIAFLNTETSRIDNLISTVEQAIEKLQEYRSSLISAAVTGKIDVRNE